jgi:hypothetical protein
LEAKRYANLDWKQWVIAATGVTANFITRAVTNGAITPPA